MSTTFALARLWISALSYRSGRPRVVVRESGVITTVSPSRSGDGPAQRDELHVHALLVNRGQAPVQLADLPLVLEFQRACRRRAHRRGGPDGPPVFVSITTQPPRTDIGGFEGLEISGALPEDFVTRAAGDAWLCRLRLRVKLSTGDVVAGRWFPPPTGAERSIDSRRAELRQEAGPAMRDLVEAPGSVPTGTTRRTRLHGETLTDYLQRRQKKPTWFAIARIIDALEAHVDMPAPGLELRKRRWGTSLAVARTDDELRNER
ncbi:hypothetical protein ACWEOG_15080 [Amycolatopsis japonica]